MLLTRAVTNSLDCTFAGIGTEDPVPENNGATVVGVAFGIDAGMMKLV